MKVKAIIHLIYCRNFLLETQGERCPYTYYDEENCVGYSGGIDYYDEENVRHINDFCSWQTRNTIYMDKEVKDIEIDRTEGISVKIGRKVYYNNAYEQQIEELIIDNKAIIKDYEEVKETLED